MTHTHQPSNHSAQRRMSPSQGFTMQILSVTEQARNWEVKGMPELLIMDGVQSFPCSGLAAEIASKVRPTP